MFTGIVKQIGSISDLKFMNHSLSLQIKVNPEFIAGIQKGASVAVDGVCLTVVNAEQDRLFFDVIEETLIRTTLKNLSKGERVNLERSAQFGDEIGGHLLSGHIYGTVEIEDCIRSRDQHVLVLRCPKEWTKYLFPKGYVALNGASLTLVKVDLLETHGRFTVHLIPETLRQTTFASKAIGEFINLELDAHTQAIVDTVERMIKQKYQEADD